MPANVAGWAIVGMIDTPVTAPGACLVSVRIIYTVGIPAFDILKIVEYLVISRYIIPDLVVADMEVTAGAGAVSVTGHIYKSHARIFAFQLGNVR